MEVYVITTDIFGHDSIVSEKGFRTEEEAKAHIEELNRVQYEEDEKAFMTADDMKRCEDELNNLKDTTDTPYTELLQTYDDFETVANYHLIKID